MVIKEIELQPRELTVVIVGLPGAGKTTIAKQLHGKYPQYKLFHTDDYIDGDFKGALQRIIQEVLFHPAEMKIIEGVQAYRLLREGLERKFYPNVVINVLAETLVRYERRPDKQYGQMDHMLRTIWRQYGYMPNSHPPRIIDLLNND